LTWSQNSSWYLFENETLQLKCGISRAVPNFELEYGKDYSYVQKILSVHQATLQQLVCILAGILFRQPKDFQSHSNIIVYLSQLFISN